MTGSTFDSRALQNSLGAMGDFWTYKEDELELYEEPDTSWHDLFEVGL